jgi:hypothetical protein
VPGNVIECGVFKGNSLVRFLTYRSLLENNFSREIYGFDIFGKFPNAKNINDKVFVKKWEKESNNGISQKELETNLYNKKFENFKLIGGNILKTIPKFLRDNTHIKIALLHLDMDIYEPTKYALNKFFKYMSSGGIILLDDYSTIYGATKAVNEFLKKNKFKNLMSNIDRNINIYLDNFRVLTKTIYGHKMFLLNTLTNLKRRSHEVGFNCA